MEQPVSTKRARASWYFTVIHRLTKYKQNLDRIAYLTKELSTLGTKVTPAYSDQPHGSGTSDATGDLATKIGDKHTNLLELQRENGLIDYAVSMLSEQKQLIIKTKYFEENQDKYAQWALRKQFGVRARQTYYSMKDEAIKELARMMMGEEG